MISLEEEEEVAVIWDTVDDQDIILDTLLHRVDSDMLDQEDQEDQDQLVRMKKDVNLRITHGNIQHEVNRRVVLLVKKLVRETIRLRRERRGGMII